MKLPPRKPAPSAPPEAPKAVVPPRGQPVSKPPPRQGEVAADAEAVGQTTQESLEIAGQQLQCTRSDVSLEQAGLNIAMSSWMSNKVPGFLVRSTMKTEGVVQGDPPPRESDDEEPQEVQLAIHESSTTVCLGFDGRLTCEGDPSHPWADFAPGSWVRLRTTVEEMGPEGPIHKVTESYQKLVSVGEPGVEVALELTDAEGEVHEETLLLSLEAADDDEIAEAEAQSKG